MKKVYTLFTALFIALNVFSQSPNKISYQAVVRNASGVLMSNQIAGFRISILQGATTGSSVYTETHTSTTNVNGLVSIEIGGGSPQNGTFNNIDWANGPFFIKTETDPSGGANYTISGISQLLSVPYALHAKTAESVSGGFNEIDPVFNSSLAKNISIVDTARWNENHIQQFRVSSIGDTLFLTRGNWVIIPGLSISNSQPLIDIDGNSYSTIQLGSQVWMAEDLRVTRLNDGTAIPQKQVLADWNNTNSLAWCYNSNNQNCNYNAKLYNFWVVNSSKVCPAGWHVPSFNEWFGANGLKTWIINNYPSQATNAGGVLKTTDTTDWSSPNTGALNLFKFSVRPTGARNLDGNFFTCRTKATYHINNTFGGGEAHYVELSNTSGDIYRVSPYRGNAPETWKMGNSIRCVKN